MRVSRTGADGGEVPECNLGNRLRVRFRRDLGYEVIESLLLVADDHQKASSLQSPVLQAEAKTRKAEVMRKTIMDLLQITEGSPQSQH